MADRERYAPFERDVEALGAYQYTSEALVSACMANRRYTEMILDAADFDGRSVVDVGCGDGTYTAHLAEFSKARRILGIEPSPKAVERARTCYSDRYSQLEFICGTSEDLLGGPRRFDIAVYRGVIHHVPDPVAELRRGLALARQIIVLEPNGQNPAMKLAEVLSSYHRGHGERSFSCARMCRWIAMCNGSVRRARYFGLVPYFCPAVIARVGRWMEPVVERIPLVRMFACGQYIVSACRATSYENPANQQRSERA